MQGTRAPTFVSAAVVLWPRVCQYQLEVTFGVETAFAGDEPVPGGGVTGAAYTPRRRIPPSLKLARSARVIAYHGGCARAVVPDEQGCYQFGGSWANDFSTLKSCHSVVAATCGPDDEGEGAGHMSWSLVPTFTRDHP